MGYHREGRDGSEIEQSPDKLNPAGLTCEVRGDEEERGTEQREAEAQASFGLDRSDGPGGIAC